MTILSDLAILENALKEAAAVITVLPQNAELTRVATIIEDALKVLAVFNL